MKEFNLSEKIENIGPCAGYVSYYRESWVKEFIRLRNEEKEDLKKQLLIDFKVPMTKKSAKRFIESRFEMSNERDKKLAGDKLV